MQARFLKYHLKTAWGIVPVLPAARSFPSSSGCGARSTAAELLPVKQILLGISLTLTETFAEPRSRESANSFGDACGACARLCFLPNPGGVFKHVLLLVGEFCLG